MSHDWDDQGRDFEDRLIESAIAKSVPSPGKFAPNSVRAMVVNGMSLVHSYRGKQFSGVVANGAEHIVAAPNVRAVQCLRCGAGAAWPPPPQNGGNPPAPLFGDRSKDYALYLTVFLNKFAAQHVGCKKEETE